MVNSLDFFRAVELRLQAGATITRAYEQVAKEARARGFKVSARTVRAMYAKAESWLAENPFNLRTKLRVLNRFHHERGQAQRGQALLPVVAYRRRNK
jgi:hypothetical protein